MASPNSTNSNSNLSPSSLPSSSSDERSLLCTPRTRAAAKKAAELLAALKNKKVAVAKEPRSAKRSLSVVPEEPRKKVVAPTKAITLAKRRKTKKELKAEKMAEFLAADSRRPANFTAEEAPQDLLGRRKQRRLCGTLPWLQLFRQLLTLVIHWQ